VVSRNPRTVASFLMCLPLIRMEFREIDMDAIVRQKRRRSVRFFYVGNSGLRADW
jgi:hypothetical protein